MYGVDVSHWQGKIDWSKFDLDFAILKATQGTTFIDDQFSRNKSEARKNKILLGFYHFANGGDPVREANFFLKTVGELQEGEFYVLDFEIHIDNIEVWCKKFLTEVYSKTGIRPLLYINSATAKSVDWTIIAKYYGLWIANYGINDGSKGKEPAIGAFPYYVMWQYTSNGIAKGITTRCDLNYCPYSKEVLKKYGQPKIVVAPAIIKEEIPTPIPATVISEPVIPVSEPVVEQPDELTTQYLKNDEELHAEQPAPASKVEEKNIVVIIVDALARFFNFLIKRK